MTPVLQLVLTLCGLSSISAPAAAPPLSTFTAVSDSVIIAIVQSRQALSESALFHCVRLHLKVDVDLIICAATAAAVAMHIVFLNYARTVAVVRMRATASSVARRLPARSSQSAGRAERSPQHTRRRTSSHCV